MKADCIKKIFISGLLFWAIASCTAGSARFPEPQDQPFKRKTLYEIPHDELWGIVTDVLHQQNIEILRYSKVKSRILTHYIVGETNIYPGIGAATTTRYRYDINLGKINANQTSLIIKVKIEAKSLSRVFVPNSSIMIKEGWHDISKDSIDLCNQLEDWLYEKFNDY